MAFQEKGAKTDDGVLEFIQANCIPFDNRRVLPELVAQKVKEKIGAGEWDPEWRDELALTRDDSKEYVQVARYGNSNKPARFYHVEVHNLHRDKIARNCTVFLESIEKLSTTEVSNPVLLEYKWEGTIPPTVSIPPKKSRRFDAFYIFNDMPKTINLGLNPFIVDFSGYVNEHTITTATDHRLTFVVFAENLQPVRRTFSLHVGAALNDADFSAV